MKKIQNNNALILCIGFNSLLESRFNTYFTHKNYTIKFVSYTQNIDQNLIDQFDVCLIYSVDDFDTIRNLIELKDKEIICLMGKIKFDCSFMLLTDNVIYCLDSETHPKDIELFIIKLQAKKDSSSNLNNWLLNTEKGELIASDNSCLSLTKMETTIVKSIIKSGSNYINRNELTLALKIHSNPRAELILNTTISRLRKKLTDFDSAIRIKTWRRNGYSLEGVNISIKPTHDEFPDGQ